jgi:hypothetical protein
LGHEDLSSAGVWAPAAVPSTPQLDTADVGTVGDQPQRDYQPPRLLGSWTTSAAQKADCETFEDAHGEKSRHYYTVVCDEPV